MNTVVFLTQQNKAEMAEAIKDLADKQTSIVNGAFVVCHQSCISQKEAHRLAAPLISKFRTGGFVKAASNLSLAHDGQIAVMFARFVALAYIRYPGPWLILDEPVRARVNDWAKAALDLHNLHGGKVVSCVKPEGKSLLAVGPMTIQLSVKAMKMLHFATNESWRSRGRFLLMNAGLRALDPKDSVFVAPQAAQAVAQEPIPEPEPAKAPKQSVGGDDEDRRILMDMIERYTGKRPHHFTGIDKLKEMAQKIEQQANA